MRMTMIFFTLLTIIEREMTKEERKNKRVYYYEILDQRINTQKEIEELTELLARKRQEDSVLRDRLKEIDGEINEHVLSSLKAV